MPSPPTALALLLFQALGGGPADDASTRFRSGAGTSGAAAAAPARTPASYDGSALQIEVPNPRIPGARIRVDGLLDDGAWTDAPVLHGLTQYEPVEGVAASQRTEVRVLLSGGAIHFAVEAFDDQPGGIRATLAERDGFGRSDDYVRIILDTFDDQRRAFVFQVNPLGVQGDGLWVEGREGRGDPIDWNPDFLWESEGRLGPDRYVVEVRIPLKSLRFPALPEQDWGLQIQRTVQRNGYESSWAPLTRARATRLAQAGRLSGLRDLDPGLFLEINPVATATRVGAWSEEHERFRRDPVTGALGLNLTYGLTSNLTPDGTFNPDFSQVEADAGQITVNERFDLRLAEKRPFFLEGTDIFETPAQLVYTRSIADPLGAAKLSGKVGGVSVAYLGALDEGQGSGSDHAVNLVRLKGDVGRSSTLGAVYTDRTLDGDDFNRVMGADGRFVLGGRYALDLMAAASADATAEEGPRWGSLFRARLARAGRNLSLSVSLEDVDDAFRARSGFIRRTGVTRAEARARYRWRGGRGALVESWGPGVDVGGTWARDDFWAGRGPGEAEVELNLYASFRGNVGGYLSYSRTAFSVGTDEYEGLFVAGRDGEAAVPFAASRARFRALHRLRLRSWINRWERVRISLEGSWREMPIFDLWRGLPAESGESWEGELDLWLQPTGSLSAEMGVRHATIFRDRDGSRYSSATIPRFQARYQFSRALFARAIAEYAARDRGPVLDPETGRPLLECADGVCSSGEPSATYDLSVEGLVGYEPSPGTVVFLGYTRRMRDTRGLGFQELTPETDGLFVKVAYRLRV